MIRKQKRPANEIPQSSLADMAFLLLIFFIATTTFAVERGLPLILPSARESVALSVRPADVLRIEGHADGTVWVDEENVPIDRIADLVRQGNAARRAAGRDELVVLIETDPRAEYRLMLEILDQVRLADSRRVALKQLGGG